MKDEKGKRAYAVRYYYLTPKGRQILAAVKEAMKFMEQHPVSEFEAANTQTEPQSSSMGQRSREGHKD